MKRRARCSHTFRMKNSEKLTSLSASEPQNLVE
jgi:hypothetical protein